MVMAHYTWCPKCDMDTLHHNHECTICAERIRREERAVWLSLTAEEKIEKLLKRIEILERNPVRY